MMGFDTAVNITLTEINEIRDTAVSLERTFIVGMIGSGRFPAAEVGSTAGAEVILVLEVPYDEVVDPPRSR